MFPLDRTVSPFQMGRGRKCGSCKPVSRILFRLADAIIYLGWSLLTTSICLP